MSSCMVLLIKVREHSLLPAWLNLPFLFMLAIQIRYLPIPHRTCESVDGR